MASDTRTLMRIILCHYNYGMYYATIIIIINMNNKLSETNIFSVGSGPDDIERLITKEIRPCPHSESKICPL